MLLTFRQSHAQSNPKDNAAALFKTLAIRDSLVYDDLLNTCNMDELSTLLAPYFQLLQDNGGPKFTGVVGRDRFIKDFKGYCARNNNPAAMKKVRRVVPGPLQPLLPGKIQRYKWEYKTIS